MPAFAGSLRFESNAGAGADGDAADNSGSDAPANANTEARADGHTGANRFNPASHD
jgi:hypothetical protein